MENKVQNLRKGGRKGGTKFPNYSLKQIIPCLKELLSKTHAKTITIEQLNAGVFKMNANSPEGKIKQYSNITSTELSSQIVLASEDEKSNYLKQAVLTVATFKNVFETFQDSSVQKSKVRGYSVSNLKIHIDSSDKFLKSFLDSCEIAKLCSFNGDEVSFISGKDVLVKKNDDEEKNNEDLGSADDESIEDLGDSSEDENDDFAPATKKDKQKTNRANIDLKIDPTLDADKLEKQLKVLRKYGLIQKIKIIV